MCKQFCIFCFLILSSFSLSAATAILTEGDYGEAALSDAINDQLRDIVDDFNGSNTIKLLGNQNRFASSMSDANSALYVVGSFYSGTALGKSYATLGVIGGSTEYLWNIGSLEDDIANGKDTQIGVGVSGLSLGIGLNGNSWELMPLPELTVDIRVSFIDTGEYIDDAHFRSLTFGAMGHYKIGRFPIGNKVVKMNSISLGAGCFINYSKATSEANSLSKKRSGKSGDTYADISTMVSLEGETVIENSIVTLPLELVTSFTFGNFFQLFLGSGVDLCLGYSSIKTDLNSSVRVYDGDDEINSDNPSVITVEDTTTKESAQLLNYKIMTGIGFSIADVIYFDIPFVYYPTSGFATSFVIGVPF